MVHKNIKRFRRGFDIVAEHRIAESAENGGAISKIRKWIRVLEYQCLPFYFGGVPGWRLKLRQMLGKERVLPDFAVVGPPKSGTSDIICHILLHPNILAPISKEINSPYPSSWFPYYPTQRQLNDVKARLGAARTGYFSPFLHWSLMAECYRLSVPNAKIVILLRDPVHRAYSQWKWEAFLSRSLVNKLPRFHSFTNYIDSAIDRFPSTAMDSLLNNGIYDKSVALWMENFGKENVLIINSSDYYKDRNSVLNVIYDFLGLESASVEESDVRINENPMVFPPPLQSDLDKLAEFYFPHNKRLYYLLGREFDWCQAEEAQSVQSSAVV